MLQPDTVNLPKNLRASREASAPGVNPKLIDTRITSGCNAWAIYTDPLTATRRAVARFGPEPPSLRNRYCSV